jgi:hypothetical protein
MSNEGKVKQRRIEVNDLIQQNYVYLLTEPMGDHFHPDFRPELTPKQMLALGVFGGKNASRSRVMKALAAEL